MTTVKRHTDREYEEELQRVRDNLLLMAGRVDHMIEHSVRALLDGDVESARKMIAEDRTVNRLEIDTDDLCLVILARRQPVASDLRFITLAMKMVTDLERIGDLAVNIGERALALDGYRPAEHGPQIARMATIACQLLREAIDAFIEGDAERAERLCARDAEVDELYWRVVVDVQAAMLKSSAFVERGMHLVAVAKFLERIGDHTTNLSELAVFMVRGKDIRHKGNRDTKSPPIR
jgi:phosphate transport system protein